jgi:hypothetical protein
VSGTRVRRVVGLVQSTFATDLEIIAKNQNGHYQHWCAMAAAGTRAQPSEAVRCEHRRRTRVGCRSRPAMPMKARCVLGFADGQQCSQLVRMPQAVTIGPPMRIQVGSARAARATSGSAQMASACRIWCASARRPTGLRPRRRRRAGTCGVPGRHEGVPGFPGPARASAVNHALGYAQHGQSGMRSPYSQRSRSLLKEVAAGRGACTIAAEVGLVQLLAGASGEYSPARLARHELAKLR